MLNINVGILGHVDSGKTSLVKALSTTLSTAALDKHPQSQQRGITLDLGFSAFTLPLPKRFQNDPSISEHYDYLQFTLVDCPGHASLIRTIIGGAQIIDMIVLVIDVTKGIQTQTAECIVIGEITSDSLLIALNKIDLLPEEQREERIQRMTRRIRKTLQPSKFATAEIVPVSAVVGGEKVAAIGGSMASSIPSAPPTTISSGPANTAVQSLGMAELVTRITDLVRIVPPDAATASSSSPTSTGAAPPPFYFAVDHCFAVKGHGTVLTGTVLSGTAAVNQLIEIPALQQERKIKSMQMFRKSVKRVKQGDRVGICVTNLDPTTIERGFVCSPGSVPLVSAVVCLVRKVRFCKLSCRSGMKVHVTLGHQTLLATTTFFGAEALATSDTTAAAATATAATPATPADATQAAAHFAAYQQAFPRLAYSPHEHYPWQDELLGSHHVSRANDASAIAAADGPAADETLATRDGTGGGEPLQWALIQFPHPIYVPDHALVIGSRLDADIQDHVCRLAFYGPVRYSFVAHGQPTTTEGAAASSNGLRPQPLLLCPRVSDKAINDHVHVYHLRHKDCEVFRIVDQRRLVLSDARASSSSSSSAVSTVSKRSAAASKATLSADVYVFEVIVWKLVKDQASLSPFLGLQVSLPDCGGVVGDIVGLYDTDKLRVVFRGPYGALNVRVGMKVDFPYQRYVFFQQTHATAATANAAIANGPSTNPAPSRHMVQRPELFPMAATAAAAAAAAAPETSTLVWETVHAEGTALTMGAASASSASGASSQSKSKKPKKPRATATTATTADEAAAPDAASTASISTATATATAAATTPIVTPATVATAAPLVPDPSSVVETVNSGDERIGRVESVKVIGPGVVDVVVTGAFRMEENVKRLVTEQLVRDVRWSPAATVSSLAVVGELLGPFGKLGKCKVRLQLTAEAVTVASAAWTVQPEDSVRLTLVPETSS